MKAKLMLTRAKITLIIGRPWFGQLSCYLNLIEDNQIPTLGIKSNGDLHYNPKFVTDLTSEQLIGVLCHEILHLALLHPFRVQHRNSIIWNVAADLKVNDELMYGEAGIILPEGGLVPDRDHSWSYEDFTIVDIDQKTTEQIYYELMSQNLKKIPAFLIDLVGSNSNVESEKQIEKVSAEWKLRIESVNAQCQGNIPGSILREIKELETPTLQWSSILKMRFRKHYRIRSWKKPNKKYLPIYCPGLKKAKGLKAVVAIDTSGSMSDSQLARIKAEILNLAQTFRNIRIIIMTCDTKVYDVYVIDDSSFSKLEKIQMRGGGGTDFNPVFEKIKEEHYNDIDCLVYFTDGYGDFPTHKPKYEVYWVSDNVERIKWPFGKVIKLI